MSARVDIIIPTYNSAATIERAIVSAAVQTYSAINIIVVDDCSQDDTVEICRRVLAREQAARPSLSYTVIVQDKNGGPSLARNAAVRAGEGVYVAFLDSDDVWMPQKLERQIALMDADPAIRLCGGQAQWVDEQGRHLGPLYQNAPDRLENGWKRLMWDCYIGTPSAVVRRCDLGEQPFDPELVVGEDRDLWIRLASNGTVALVQDTVALFQVSQGSYMARHAMAIEKNTRRMLWKHVRDFADHLSLRDVLKIHGKLCSDIGKGYCSEPGTYWKGAGYLLQGIVLHNRRVDCLRHLVLTAPGIRQLKQFIKQRLQSA